MKKFIGLSVIALMSCTAERSPTSHVNPAPAAAVAIPAPPPAPSRTVAGPIPSKPVSRHVLIIGDSEACAVGFVAKEVAMKWSTQNGMPLDDVAVECKGGTVVQYWGPGLHARLALQAHPKTDTLIVFLGTNHYWQKTLPDPKMILDEVTNRKLSCVWVGNVAVKGKTWPINAEIRKAVAPTCDYFDAEQEPIKLWDGVHPDRSNARKWLSDVWVTIPLKYEKSND